jgi:hypothetical protein
MSRRILREDLEKLGILGIGVGEKQSRLCFSPVYVQICKQTFMLIQRKAVFPVHDVFVNYLYPVNVICVLIYFVGV